MVVPSAANRSTRFRISASGTGAETASNSLQYVQARLHRRIGTICTRMGWCLETIARANMRDSRKRRRMERSFRRKYRGRFSQYGIPFQFTVKVVLNGSIKGRQPLKQPLTRSPYQNERRKANWICRGSLAEKILPNVRG